MKLQQIILYPPKTPKNAKEITANNHE